MSESEGRPQSLAAGHVLGALVFAAWTWRGRFFGAARVEQAEVGTAF